MSVRIETINRLFCDEPGCNRPAYGPCVFCKIDLCGDHPKILVGPWALKVCSSCAAKHSVAELLALEDQAIRAVWEHYYQREMSLQQKGAQ